MTKKKPRPGQPSPPKPKISQPQTKGATISPYRMRVLMTIGQAEQDGNTASDAIRNNVVAFRVFMNTVNELQVAGLVSRSTPFKLTKKGRAVWNAVRVALGLSTEKAAGSPRRTNTRALSKILRAEE